MNEQEKAVHLSSQIDRLLEQPASLLVHEENMLTDDQELLELAQRMAGLNFSAQSRFLRRRQQTKGASMNTLSQRITPQRRRMWLAGGVMAALFLLALLTLPPVRALAQEVWQSLFTRHDSDNAILPEPYTVTLEPTASPIPVAVPQLNMTVADAEAMAGYDVLEPGYMPAGYQLSSVHYDAGATAVTQLYLQGGVGISLRQEPAATAEAWFIGQSAVVESKQIGHLSAEYVRGAWNEVAEVDSQGNTAVVSQQTWNPDDPYQRLRWTDGQMAYTIGTTVGQETGLQAADLIAIAESLR